MQFLEVGAFFFFKMSIRGEVVTYLRRMAGGVWLTRWPWMFKHGLRAVIMCDSGARSKPYDKKTPRRRELG
jgi:hypothetical protein